MLAAGVTNVGVNCSLKFFLIAISITNSKNTLIICTLNKTMQLELNRKLGFRLNKSHRTSDVMAT